MSLETNQINERWRQSFKMTVEERGLSQSELARRAGISKSQISRILSSKSSLTVPTFEKLAAVLELTSIDLIMDRQHVEGRVGTMSELNLALFEFPRPLRERLQTAFWSLVSTARQARYLQVD